MMNTTDTAVVDVDGTLVDTVYHHTVAWSRAFAAHGCIVPLWRIHRAVGMGGDQLVPAVAGQEFEDAHGDDARAAWKREFDPMLPELRSFGGARELLMTLSDEGLTVVLASSGAPEHVEAYLDLFDGAGLSSHQLTRDDVDRTKPEPDLIGVAVERAGGTAALVVGDSPWDVHASAAAGHPAYAVRTGGFGEDELREAGAVDVFASLDDLRTAVPRLLGR